MTRVRVALALVLLAAVSGPLAAQTAAEPDDWRITFTPYAWMSGVKGTVGIGANTAEVDAPFTESVEDFDIGFAGVFESRRHPWVLRADVFYVSLSDEEAVSAGQVLTVGQDEFMLNPEVGYTLLARPWGGVDGLIGARYWNMSVDLALSPQEVSGDRNWVDGTVGALFRYEPADKWHLNAKADIGAGGSDFTWQVYGGAGYDLGSCCSLVGVYRFLDVDYDKDDVLFDMQISGPALGVTLRF